MRLNWILIAPLLSAACLRVPAAEPNDSGTTDDPSGTDPTDETSTGDPNCGDGTRDPGEGCDDGNDIDEDACPSGAMGQCQAPASCGDGIVWEGEEDCDGGEGRTAECTQTPAECGNGTKEAGEACDDGNKVDEDACPSGAMGGCQAEASCGDGITWTNLEACDEFVLFSGRMTQGMRTLLLLPVAMVRAAAPLQKAAPDLYEGGRAPRAGVAQGRPRKTTPTGRSTPHTQQVTRVT